MRGHGPQWFYIQKRELIIKVLKQNKKKKNPLIKNPWSRLEVAC